MNPPPFEYFPCRNQTYSNPRVPKMFFFGRSCKTDCNEFGKFELLDCRNYAPNPVMQNCARHKNIGSSSKHFLQALVSACMQVTQICVSKISHIKHGPRGGWAWRCHISVLRAVFKGRQKWISQVAPMQYTIIAHLEAEKDISCF